ncbi:MAG TPA: DUF6263 family protein, partial [Flavisolibacter sp.]|nr:DUF6263 family protein [Flavisolibacter sp.]
KSIKFKAEGMGQSQTFDSDNENDRSGEIGKSLASSLKAKYSITVDAKGNITSVKADTGSTASKTDPMLGMLLAQLSVSTTPPKVGDATIFKILPDKEVSKGSSWTDSTSDETGKKITVYAITNVTDKEIFIDFTDNSTLNTTQQIMGFDAKINTKSNGNGQIIIDRSTGILKQKKASVKSEQTIEAQGQKLPSTANLTIVTTVL